MEHELARDWAGYTKIRKDFPEYYKLNWDYELSRYIDLNIDPRVFISLTDKILWDIMIRFFRRVGLESLKRTIKYFVRVEMSSGEFMPVYWFRICRMNPVDIDNYEVGEVEDKEMGEVFRKLYCDVVSEVCVDRGLSHKTFQELCQAVIVRYKARSVYCMSDEEYETYKKSTPWHKKDKEEAEIDLSDEDLEELEKL